MSVQVQITEKSPVARELRITVPADQVTRTWNAVLQQYVDQANIPGFRKGKAPRQMVEKQFMQRIMQDSLQRTISESYREALMEVKLMPLAQPDIQPETKEFFPEKEFTFTAAFEVPPKIELKKYKGLKLEVPRSVFEEKQVEAELDYLRKSTASVVPVEGRTTVQQGDLLKLDFEGFDPEGAPLEGAKGSDFQLEIGAKQMIPGFEEALIGAHMNQDHEFEITFPADYHHVPFAGKPAKFKVHVREISEKKLDAMDDLWAKKLDQPSLDALKNEVRESIKSRSERQFEEERKAILVQELVKLNEITAPQVMVQQQLSHLVQTMRTRLTQQGAPEAKVSEILMGNLERLKTMAESQVKAELLVHEVARQEQIALTEEELDEHLKKWQQNADMPLTDLKARLMQEGSLDSIRHELTDEKVYNFLIREASVKEIARAQASEP